MKGETMNHYKNACDFTEAETLQILHAAAPRMHRRSPAASRLVKAMQEPSTETNRHALAIVLSALEEAWPNDDLGLSQAISTYRMSLQEEDVSRRAGIVQTFTAQAFVERWAPSGTEETAYRCSAATRDMAVSGLMNTLDEDIRLVRCRLEALEKTKRALELELTNG